MRCKNCGWPNQPGEKECRKCHAPLDMNGTEELNTSQERPLMDQVSSLKKTVLEAPTMNAELPKATVMEAAEATVCKQCGFPLRPNAVKCPKCGMDQNPSSNTAHRATVVHNINADVDPTKKEGVTFKKIKENMKTVNPYLDGFDPVPACMLKPIKRSSERKALDNIEFEGENIQLNRANTDPENITIASDIQAEIVRENGKWYINDKSETHTTFVRAGEKVEISEGAIILLGNRLFEFHIQ